MWLRKPEPGHPDISRVHMGDPDVIGETGAWSSGPLQSAYGDPDLIEETGAWSSDLSRMY